jgi:hypothetical protein
MNFLPGMASTSTLLISVSQVVRIVGMSHQCLTSALFLSLLVNELLTF